MLWNLFSSDRKVMEALSQSSKAHDLSPATIMPANNDAPPLDENGKPRRLWLEDWSEKDEARLRTESELYFA